MDNLKFLKEKYDLHKAPEVERAAKRIEKCTGEKVPQDPAEQIQNYLNRLERLALDPKKEQKRKMFRDEPRPRALFLLREMLMNKYVRSNKERMAESAAQVEERAARALGIEARYGERELVERGEIAVEDLEKSLDSWISYLSDANEPYPVWFRYYAFRNILDLGDYDKDKGEFTKRSPGSFRLFPEIDRGALAYIQERMEAAKDPAIFERLRKAQIDLGTPADQLISKEKAVNFAKLGFAKQYAEGIKQAGEITPELREEIKGKWIRYQQGTDPTALWSSLQNKGTAWCTKGFATAETQLKGGDFYVYYTSDRQGNFTIPRIAIRMQEGQIAEMRGVADSQQNLEGNMAEIADEKLKSLPGAEKYRKASVDMKTMTYLIKKQEQGLPFTKEELFFLYEINSKIEGFGYQKDPRIKELLSQRIIEEDMSIIFECAKSQIAHNSGEINENTKVYVGLLESGIFDIIQKYNIEHIYTSFPEGRIRIEKDFEAGPITMEEFNEKAHQYNAKIKDELLEIRVSEYANHLIKSKNFSTLRKTEKINLIRLKVGDLFSDNRSHTTIEIYQRAQELGLELCPPEIGPLYRFQYQNQPLGEWVYIGMKTIIDRDGDPRVFYLGRTGGGLWLRGYWARPGSRWRPDYGFVFVLRPPKAGK